MGVHKEDDLPHPAGTVLLAPVLFCFFFLSDLLPSMYTWEGGADQNGVSTHINIACC